MKSEFVAGFVFVFTYIVNMFYITVLYHRGLAHGSVRLKPWMRRFTIATGNWVTGIDPKAWACMHRQHHLYSDTKDDPHSPWNDGVFGIILQQLHAYQRTLSRLDRNIEAYARVVKDLDFPIHWVNRRRIWWLPYFAQALVGGVLALAFHAPLVALAYFFGMMSHPVQGWLVNSFAHKYGYQNFNNGDESRNNVWVAWLVMGEGYQNNHHARPFSARFSVRWFEWDAGYLMCQIAAKLGLVEITKTAH